MKPADDLKHQLRVRFERWLFRVHKPEPAPLRLGQRRIFVLPTGFGLAFGLSLVVMLLASINYAISLGYALTFLVAGVGWVSIHHAFRNLVNLEVSPGKVEPVFAGDMAHFHVLLHNASPRHRWQLRLAPSQRRQPLSPDTLAAFDIPPGTHAQVRVDVPTQARGWHALPRLHLETRYPLGLIRAWSLFQPQLRCLVYPQPEAEAPPLPLGLDEHPGQHGHSHGQDDFAGLRSYQQTDSPRHVAWKAVARGGPWMTKQFIGQGSQAVWLDWATLPHGLNPEARLARLCRWVLDAESQHLSFGLRLPGLELPLGQGPEHTRRCLSALATFGLRDDEQDPSHPAP
ncbi:DUF58 domain-containing protein [Zoogloea sp.]|uniref:DUF58 domain-containing protein n=1 Tax=Zoogloea sp. TaxID=49181 RepID=UPI0035AF359C